MAYSDSTEREDPRLNADPMLMFSDGRANSGQKLFIVAAVTLAVLGTIYGITHGFGEAPRATAVTAHSGAVLH